MKNWNNDFFHKIKWNLKMKMTLYSIFVLCLAGILQLVLNNAFISDFRLIEAFSIGNATEAEGNLSCFASYPKTYLSEEDKKQLLVYLAEELGIHTNENDWSKDKKEEKQILHLKKKAKDGDVSLSFISIGTKEESQEYYIYVELQLYHKLDSLLVYKKRLCNCLKELKVEEYQPLISFSGEYDGALTEEEREEREKEMFSILKAEVVNETTSANTTNIYGYTEFLEEYLIINKKRVNVNLVMTYDETRDKTKLYLAAPIYNKDY